MILGVHHLVFDVEQSSNLGIPILHTKISDLLIGLYKWDPIRGLIGWLVKS